MLDLSTRPCSWYLFAGWMLALGGVPITSAEDFLPPELPWQGASERLLAPPDDPWITPGEQSGLTESPDYAQTVAWLKKLDDASPLVQLRVFGQTAEGRELVVAIASREGGATPGELRANGRPTLLAQAGIHAGEIDGKDAGMMLLRDIAFRGESALLDKANLLFIPVLNADGHERASPWNRPNQRGPARQGWRTTAQNLNLNRDYVKLDAPEMQALLRLINQWQPSLYLDIHVTDGVDYQYDITYGFNGWNGDFAWSPQIGKWLDTELRPDLDGALSDAGHIPGPLVFAVDRQDITQGISLGAYNPRYSSGYGDLRHLPTVLVENHSLKPYRQRVLGTRVLLEAALETLGERAASLRAAIADDSAARPQSIWMNWGGRGSSRCTIDFLGVESETYISPASGARVVRWLGTRKTYPEVPVFPHVPGVALRRPKAYIVPATKPDVIARLRWHGIQMQRMTEPTTLPVSMYRLVDPQPDAMPYEGRHRMTTGLGIETLRCEFPAGSVRVSTDQPLGDLVVVMLAPTSVDSLLAWGFFPEILQRTEYIERYAIAPLAEQMLQDDAALNREFQSKLAEDQDFASDAQARLRWFYERSRYYDQRYLRYPIGIQ
jgi:murein tripeptide amidase MpaA